LFIIYSIYETVKALRLLKNIRIFLFFSSMKDVMLSQKQ
jgi:hypothetical protein